MRRLFFCIKKDKHNTSYNNFFPNSIQKSRNSSCLSLARALMRSSNLS